MTKTIKPVKKKKIKWKESLELVNLLANELLWYVIALLCITFATIGVTLIPEFETPFEIYATATILILLVCFVLIYIFGNKLKTWTSISLIPAFCYISGSHHYEWIKISAAVFICALVYYLINPKKK